MLNLAPEPLAMTLFPQEAASTHWLPRGPQLAPSLGLGWGDTALCPLNIFITQHGFNIKESCPWHRPQ